MLKKNGNKRSQRKVNIKFRESIRTTGRTIDRLGRVQVMIIFIFSHAKFRNIKYIHRNDLAKDEYDLMKEETVDQIKEFTETLDRMHKGDVSLNNKFSEMRKVRRNRGRRYA